MDRHDQASRRRASTMRDELLQLEALVAEGCTAPDPRRSACIGDLVGIVEVSNQGAALRPLVAAIGPQITSTDIELRGTATRLMARVLTRLVAGSVSEDALRHLTEFFCARLQDYACAAPVLEAASALVALLPTSSPLRSQICDALLDETDVRSLPQAERAAALRLTLDLSGCGSNSPAGEAGQVSGLISGVPGTRLVLGVVRAFDGEKDPRNLLLYLQLLRWTCGRCEQVAADGFAEAVGEVFDSLEYYFPISFQPPTDDENGITQAHLLAALLRTLGSSRRFAPLALPFFLKHLTAPRLEDNADVEAEAEAPMQSLQAVATLARAYGADALSPHADILAHAMRAQLIQLLSQRAGGSGVAAPTQEEATARLEAICATIRALTAACLAAAPHGASVPGMSPAGTASEDASLENTSPADTSTQNTSGLNGVDSCASDPRSLLEQILTPFLGVCALPRPQGAGAAVGGRLLRAVASCAPAAAALVVRRCVPPLLQALERPGAPRAEQADALALLLVVVDAAVDASPDGAGDISRGGGAHAAEPAAGDASGTSYPDRPNTDAFGAGSVTASVLASSPPTAAAAVARFSASLTRVASDVLSAEADWPTQPSLRAPAAQLMCLSLRAALYTTPVATEAEPAAAAASGYAGCLSLLALAMLESSAADGDMDTQAFQLPSTHPAAIAMPPDSASLPTSSGHGSGSLPPRLAPCSAIAASVSRLIACARNGALDSIAAHLVTEALATVRAPLLSAFLEAVAQTPPLITTDTQATRDTASADVPAPDRARRCARLVGALAQFMIEDPGWSDGAAGIVAGVEAAFGLGLPLAEHNEAGDVFRDVSASAVSGAFSPDAILRLAADPLVATSLDALAAAAATPSSATRRLAAGLMLRLLPSWTAAAEAACLAEAEAAVEGSPPPRFSAQFSALLLVPKQLCAVLCDAHGTGDAGTPPWLCVCLAWLLPSAGDSVGCFIPSASEAARFRLMPFLEQALVHTWTRVPLPAGALERLVGASCGDEHTSAPQPLLRALCAAANKWATEPELGAAIAVAQPAAATGSVGGVYRWAWLAKASVSRGGGASAQLPIVLVDMIQARATDVDAAPAQPDAAQLLAWLPHACSCLRVLVEPLDQLLLRHTGARVVPLVGQRVVSALLPRLKATHFSARAASAVRGASVHAIVHLLLAAPPALLPRLAEYARLVSLWIHLVVSSCCPQGMTLHSAAAASNPAPAVALAPSAAVLGGPDSVRLLAAALRLLLSLAKADGSAGDDGDGLASLAEALPAALRLLTLAAADALPLSAEGHVRLVERCLQFLEMAADALPYHQLFPLKRQVRTQLQGPLDHRKRAVRSAASQCSNRWHALSATQ